MTKTYSAALRAAGDKLDAAGIDRDGANFVLSSRLNWSRSQLVLHGRDEMPDDVAQTFAEDINALLAGQPAQYVVGRAPFWGRWFNVNPAVLIPQFDTEILVEWMLEDAVGGFGIDIGTGSGAIGITLKLERPLLAMTLSDISQPVLTVAEANAKELGAEVELNQGNLLEGTGKYDFIVANLPYIDRDEMDVMDQSVIDYEPHLALFAEDHGLALFRELFDQIPRHLRPGGVVYLEFGYRQQEALAQMIAQMLPLGQAEFREDDAGHPRAVKIKF
ncbi:peptide chain release factor N(5)-glutamine methyltransferase [Lacticaseibacillus hulanensis]|uniref:peptide chain release factor N(5)-glutamine methyltransferase n=1 Tax=Lacticaseibacillus hulanensis TaxID=2493111 RepID=UPI000FD8FECE|nr:peptide chain release factor N(5)-glutamine methyltransferase [Lacticaseibacillus hulanensis]